MPGKMALVPLVLLAILCCPLASAAAAPESLPDPPDPQIWLRDVALLLSPEERAAFLSLPGESERAAFVERFWQVRDPYPETPRNELEERWMSGLAEARSRWGTLDDDRARLFLLQGEPSSAFEASCPGFPGAMELWVYEPRFRVKHRAVFVLVREGPPDGQHPARLWRPGDGAPSLPATPAASEACTGGSGSTLRKELIWLRLTGAENYRALAERALAPPKPAQPDWYAQLVSAMSATGTAEAPTLEAGLEVDYPGQVEERRVVRVMMTVPPGSLRPSAGAGPRAPQDLLVTGEVLHDRQVLDTFRYRFRVRPEELDGKGIPLAFERYLLPGFYRLKVKLEDLLSKSFFLGERELDVPGPDGSAAARVAAVPRPAADIAPLAGGPPADASAEIARLYTEASESVSRRVPGLRVFVPADTLLIGNVRFEAQVEPIPGLAADEQIERVAFLLDGRTVLTRNRPPYAVTLDLGPVPRAQTLKVEGMNAAGKILAADEMALNAGAQRFAVRLVEPRPDRPYRISLRARAEVEPPRGQSIDHVEFYLNEDLVATLYQPPFVQPITLPAQGGQAGYVRAVAYLADGAAAEDTVLLNAPAAPDAVDIRLIELYTTVVDRNGQPVEGLDGGKFKVAEDCVPQALRHVDRVVDLPVHVVTLIDNSGSMTGRMEATRTAALGFLRRILRPTDRAAVITFNRSPHVAVGFTQDLAQLSEGFTGLVAEDATSLYDSVAFALHFLMGVKGQRAILLLSDGQDRTSRFSFDQMLEYAHRTGITVYAIGLDLPDGARGDAAKKLERLAMETGGRSFFLKDTSGLEGAYQEIERDLRSQYRLTYQSTNTSTEDKFRTVQVQVAGAGLDARTISGYYP